MPAADTNSRCIQACQRLAMTRPCSRFRTLKAPHSWTAGLELRSQINPPWSIYDRGGGVYAVFSATEGVIHGRGTQNRKLVGLLRPYASETTSADGLRAPALPEKRRTSRAFGHGHQAPSDQR